LRAVGYFREIESQTLAEQSERFLWFARRNGYAAAATFLDAGEQNDHPGFRQLIDFVSQQCSRGFLVVVISGLQGLGESLTDATRRYFQLSSLGVPIVSMERDGEETAADLIAVWASQKTDNSLGQRVKAAMRQRAVRGEALGRPPFGYRVGPRRRLTIVPDEGSVVRYIFRLYLKDGLGIRRIARRLNEEQLVTRRGGPWGMVTVRDILRNRVYVGTYSRSGVRVPASHSPLIQEEDFQRVQERLDERRPAATARQHSPFLLAGIVCCGYCGNKMIGVTRRQKWLRRDGTTRNAQYRYYQCESRTNRSLCDFHTQKAEVLEEKVRALLAPGGSSVFGRSGNGAHEAADRAAEAKRLVSKSRRLDRRLAQYLDSAAAGGVNLEKLRVLAGALATEQLQVEEQLQAAHVSVRQLTSEAERRKERQNTVRRLRDDWQSLSFADKRSLIRQIFERVVVRDDGIEPVLKA